MRGSFQNVGIQIHGLGIGLSGFFKLLLPEVCRALIAIKGSRIGLQLDRLLVLLESFPVFLCLVIDYAQIVHGVGKLMVVVNSAFKVFAGFSQKRCISNSAIPALLYTLALLRSLASAAR